MQDRAPDPRCKQPPPEPEIMVLRLSKLTMPKRPVLDHDFSPPPL